MPTSKKPRRARKLHPGRKDVISNLFGGDEPMTGEERLAVLSSVHGAVIMLARGDSGKESWNQLVYAMNIAVVLCESAGNKEVGLRPLYDALNVLITMRERHAETGRLIFGVDELPKMNAGIEVWEALVDTVSRRQYVRASEQMIRRVEQGRSVKVRLDRATERFALPMAA